MNSYPARNQDNHDCIMCGNCLRTCPNGSAQWRLRPPGADLWNDHTPKWAEVNLMFVLLGAVVLHRCWGKVSGLNALGYGMAG